MHTVKPVLVALVLLLVVVSVPSSQWASAQSGPEQVVGRPELSVHAPANEFEPGQTVTLEVFLVNRGDVVAGGPVEFVERVTTARATTFRIDDSRVPFEVNTGTVPAGSVPTGSAGPFSVQLTIPEETPPGRYTLPVSVSYTYTRTVEYFAGQSAPRFTEFDAERRLSLEVEVTEEARFEVVRSESDVLVGRDGTLTLTLRNVGTEPASEASVGVESSSDDLRFGNASPGADGYVGSWPAGETRQVQYRASVADDVRPRDYALRARVQYTDIDGIQRESRSLKASVRPLAEQTFALRDVESTLGVARTGTVSGVVVNEGPEAVRSPVLVLETDAATLFAPETEYALPALEPGERAPFVFDLDVSEDAKSGPRPLTLRVRYQDRDGDQQVGDPLDARVAIGPRRDAFEVRPVGDEVPAGSSAVYRFEVTNVRNETLREIEARAFADDPLDATDTRAFQDALAPGETVEFSIRLGAAGSTLPKTYPVSVDFEYETADGESELSNTYRLPVAVVERESRGFPLGASALLAITVGALVVAWRWRSG